MFDLHANLYRQIPSNFDKLRNGNINVPKRNGEIPVIPADSGGGGEHILVNSTDERRERERREKCHMMVISPSHGGGGVARMGVVYEDKLKLKGE